MRTPIRSKSTKPSETFKKSWITLKPAVKHASLIPRRRSKSLKELWSTLDKSVERNLSSKGNISIIMPQDRISVCLTSISQCIKLLSRSMAPFTKANLHTMKHAIYSLQRLESEQFGSKIPKSSRRPKRSGRKSGRR